MDVRQIFTHIYEANVWGDSESRSGPGSSVFRTRMVRPALSQLFADFQVQSVLDIPCGDFNWMRLTEMPGVRYMGADIVPEIVQRNIALYSNKTREFICLNLISDSLPEANLILCRDGLVHLSFSQISSALDNMCRSRATYFLATTFQDHLVNEDAPTGGWRPLNLQKPPFSFAAPVVSLWDGPRPDGTYPDKMLALYRLAELHAF